MESCAKANRFMNFCNQKMLKNVHSIGDYYNIRITDIAEVLHYGDVTLLQYQKVGCV